MGEKCENLFSLYKLFFQQNKILVFFNVMLEMILPPIEITVFRWLAENFIENIDKWKEKTLVSNIYRFKKYVVYLILIQCAYFVNKLILNKLIPEFRILVREKILSNFVQEIEQQPGSTEQSNIDLTITLNAMPKALYNFYNSILKFVLPLFVLFSYVSYSLYLYDREIAYFFMFYSILNISMSMSMVNFFSMDAAKNWEMQGDLVKEYDEVYSAKKIDRMQMNTITEEEKATIVEEERTYEKKRFHYYRNLNFFIFYSISYFFCVISIVIYLFTKKNPSKLQKVLTLLVFSARFFNTLLTRLTITVDAFGRLRKLNETLTSNCSSSFS